MFLETFSLYSHNETLLKGVTSIFKLRVMANLSLLSTDTFKSPEEEVVRFIK